MSSPQLQVTSTTTVPVLEESSASTDSETVATDSPTTEAPETPSSGRSVDLFTHLEGGYGWEDLGNGRGLDHEGGYGRLQVGADIPVLGNDVYVQLSAGGTLGDTGNDLGAGVRSSLAYQAVFANVRGGVRLFEDNVRLHLGADIGAVHVGSSATEFTRNAQLLPLDQWGTWLTAEFGASFYHGVVGLDLRVGSMLGVNPHYDFVDASESNPPFGLNIPLVQVGLSLDLYAMGRELGLWNPVGGGHGTPPATEEPEDTGETPAGESDATPESGGVSPTETAATPAVGSEGVSTPETPAIAASAAVLERSTEGISERSGVLSTAATRVRGARTAYRSMRTAARGNPSILREQVEIALAQTREALQAYSQMVDLIAQAQRARLTMAGTEGRNAGRTIETMQAQQRAAYRLASQAFQDASGMAREFNHLANHGEDLSFDLAAPSAPTRAHRVVHHDTSTPREEPSARVDPETGHGHGTEGATGGESGDDILDSLSTGGTGGE